MTKPLSEIARQAWLECPLDGDHWEATVQAVRSKVIEECIQKLRGDLQAVEDTVCLPAYRDGFADAFKALQRLEALTALKDKAPIANDREE